MKLIFEKSSKGRRGIDLPEVNVPKKKINIPQKFLRTNIPLPEVSEVDVVRHYTALSRMNYGIDTGFYPLGSCTMKYNPKINEDVSRLPGFLFAHPYQPEKISQSCLKLMFNLERYLCEITGMDAYTLQPAAGAQGELTGLMLIKAYLKHKKEKRTKIILPDSSHGTNSASASICAFKAVTIKSNEQGRVDLNALSEVMNKDVAGIMLTNPNTLGIFEKDILEIIKIIHDNGGLVYCDGANMNAILGITRPGDMGFDIIHLNLHKTFSTPHGGGGPGSGPVGVKKELQPFLPIPRIEKKGENYYLNYDYHLSIGRIKAFYGNFGVMVKAYAYLRELGAKGLRQVAENAVLNANYLLKKLKSYYDLPYDQICKHEFVLSGSRQAKKGVSTMDIAKRLLDYGFHAPTIYFPLIVKEAMMIEPTETESKETLDAFADAMIKIAEEIDKNPEIVKRAPNSTPFSRLDMVKAAREPVLKWDENIVN
jgi:glycine dehydrogenase subunit 2